MSPPSLHVAASNDDGVASIPALVVNGPVSLPSPLTNGNGSGNGSGNGLHSADPHHKKGNAPTSAVMNGGVSAARNGVHKESGNASPAAANGSKSEDGADKSEKKPNTTTTTATTAASATRDNAGRHAGLGHKSILQSDALYQYMLNTSVYPREHSSQRELREITAKHPWNLMTTPPDEGQFLMLLMKLINAKNTMELGVYTGYSLLSTALALPDDGKIIAIDMNRENYQLGAPVIERAGLSHKIDFREGLILPQLDEMLQEDKNHGFFDFIFVDADKDNYTKYHERLIKLVKVGGVIGYDNTLWNGSLVAPDDAPYPKYIRHYRPFILELNTFLAADRRIDISQVPIGDGITLCRRLV